MCIIKTPIDGAHILLLVPYIAIKHELLSCGASDSDLISPGKINQEPSEGYSLKMPTEPHDLQ